MNFRTRSFTLKKWKTVLPMSTTSIPLLIWHSSREVADTSNPAHLKRWHSRPTIKSRVVLNLIKLMKKMIIRISIKFKIITLKNKRICNKICITAATLIPTTNATRVPSWNPRLTPSSTRVKQHRDKVASRSCYQTSRREDSRPLFRARER